MKKIQLLFPDPMMDRLRDLAKREDVPLSEIIRKATAQWLDRYPPHEGPSQQVPVVNAGRCLLNAQDMKAALHE
ncbi:MAG: ribbon-helix-helix domain-containing protein [Verrucomicrobiae bacterium]|nr:ribbon-helix-helix domain-containing protein [Verrucomicrobiae bacterium]